MQYDWQDVLSFWFGPLDANGMADADHQKSWWRKDPSFDAKIHERFFTLHQAILARKVDTWREIPRSCLALVIVVDQFSRNMFRDQPEMYSGDDLAQEYADFGLNRGDLDLLTIHEATFLLMPLMHSEDLPTQERCCRLFQHLADRAPEPAKESILGNLRFAKQHRDIVERFGRFPHRNAILGRSSTPEEEAFLQTPGSSF